MAMVCYLAMTTGEVSVCPSLPKKMAWMACHFSSSGPGISNLPPSLPSDTILILDDNTPFNNHDPAAISRELVQAAKQLGVRSVLLDFQRPDVPQVQELAGILATTLPCPVGISSIYAKDIDCPVFLPPLPLNQSLQEYLSPYRSREIWLDMAPCCAELHIRSQGNQYLSMSADAFPPGPFCDNILRCRYATSVVEDSVVFSLYRGQEEIKMLLEDAEKAGVSIALGLYQELSVLF